MIKALPISCANGLIVAKLPLETTVCQISSRIERIYKRISCESSRWKRMAITLSCVGLGVLFLLQCMIHT